MRGHRSGGSQAVLRLTAAAFCIVLNMAGAYLALLFRLPVYLDSLGTVLAGALMGPWYGLAAGLGSGILTGITSDIYALYFAPVGMITGVMSGLLHRAGLMKGWKMAAGVVLLTLPGTLVSSCISAFLFGGVTSSGSSLLVQILHHMGWNLTASVFAVQILTDLADRLISAVFTAAGMSCLGSELRRRLKED